MSETWNLGLKLLIITAVAALALSFTNYLTEGPIEEQRIQANMEARLAVLSYAKDFEELGIDDSFTGGDYIMELYRGIDEGNKTVGYTFKVLAKGFGGDMEVIIGIDNEGSIDGVRIGNHAETPGLGAKAADEEFVEQFGGKSIDKPIQVKKTENLDDNEIQALTGATITSEAVSDAVNLVMNYYNQILSDRGADN